MSIPRDVFAKAADTKAARRAVNEFGRSGRPILEEIRLDLLDLAEVMVEQHGGSWVLPARAEVARQIRVIAERLGKLARNKTEDTCATR